MTEKNGRRPVELVAEVQSMELKLDLDLNHDGSCKPPAGGSTVSADSTASQWANIEGMRNRGKYSVKIVGQSDYADGRLKRKVSVDLTEPHRGIPTVGFRRKIPRCARCGTGWPRYAKNTLKTTGTTG